MTIPKFVSERLIQVLDEQLAYSADEIKEVRQDPQIPDVWLVLVDDGSIFAIDVIFGLKVAYSTLKEENVTCLKDLISAPMEDFEDIEDYRDPTPEELEEMLECCCSFRGHG